MDFADEQSLGLDRDKHVQPCLPPDRFPIGWATLPGLPAVGHVRKLKTDNAEAVIGDALGERVPKVGVHARPDAMGQYDRCRGLFGSIEDPLMLLRLFDIGPSSQIKSLSKPTDTRLTRMRSTSVCGTPIAAIASLTAGVPWNA
jgi:hypothetical protein